MSDEKGVADRLKQARMERGLAVRAWAELLGNDVKPSQVTDVERGKQKPTQGMLVGAVQNAGVSHTWLLTGLGSMLATGRPANSDAAAQVLRAVTLRLEALKLDKRTQRAAHQWLAAIELGDRALLEQLADAAAAHPGVREEAGLYAGPPDPEVLARVLRAVLAAGDRMRPKVSEAVLARVAATLYTLAGRGLEIDEAAAASAIDLARG